MAAIEISEVKQFKNPLGMSLKGMSGIGGESLTPPANLRATRSNTKAEAQQTTISLQMAMLEKKKMKAKEAKEVGQEACKVLIGEKCLNEETAITHAVLLKALMQLIQKYSMSAPQSLIRALTALSALLHEINSIASQAMTTPMLETLTQKIGERVDKSLQEEMGKMRNMMLRHSRDVQPTWLKILRTLKG
ncbi:hypothetical protein EI94DRAFT_1710241 [Lactarius quietus]|nr:hypothetical protein EI94DRAFT_1710241 [Lactarius quietus]